MRIQNSPFTSKSQGTAKLSDGRTFDQKSAKEHFIRFEYLSQNLSEMLQCEELNERINQLFQDLNRLKSDLFKFVFSMSNTISVQAYVEPGQ